MRRGFLSSKNSEFSLVGDEDVEFGTGGIVSSVLAAESNEADVTRIDGFDINPLDVLLLVECAVGNFNPVLVVIADF